MKKLVLPSAVGELRMHLKRAFGKIRLQFEEHLEAINENTNEIQANYNLLKELEEKMSQLQQKEDATQSYLRRISPAFTYKNDILFEIQPLSVNEKRLLQILLAAHHFVSYKELAHALNVSLSLVRSYITNMIGKGVPIVKKYVQGKPIITVDEKFREVQERLDIAHIGQRRLDAFKTFNL